MTVLSADTNSLRHCQSAAGGPNCRPTKRRHAQPSWDVVSGRSGLHGRPAQWYWPKLGHFELCRRHLAVVRVRVGPRSFQKSILKKIEARVTSFSSAMLSDIHLQQQVLLTLQRETEQLDFGLKECIYQLERSQAADVSQAYQAAAYGLACEANDKNASTGMHYMSFFFKIESSLRKSAYSNHGSCDISLQRGPTTQDYRQCSNTWRGKETHP